MDRIEGFDLIEEIGRGGFGVVHKAFQPSLNREVAIKILTADGSDPVVRARFERECRAIGRLSSHPNVVSVHGSGTDGDNRPYLVMEYMAGGTLTERGPLGWEEACEVGVAIAGALVAAHRNDIIHRDLKPQNVLFTEFGAPKLADFGIASVVNGFETRSSSVSASLAYAAPEVLDGQPASARSDVYGLAATVMGAILGHAPFHRVDDSVSALIARVATAPPPDLRDRGVPDRVCSVLERAMAKRPEDRQADALTFGTELAAAAGLEPGTMLTGSVPVVPPEDLAPTEGSSDGSDELIGSRKETRSKGLIVAAVSIVVIALLGVAFAVLSGGGSGTVRVQSAGKDTGAGKDSAPTVSEPVGAVDDPLASETTLLEADPSDPAQATGDQGSLIPVDPVSGSSSVGGYAGGSAAGGGPAPAPNWGATGGQAVGGGQVPTGSGVTGSGSTGPGSTPPSGGGSTTTTSATTTTTPGNKAPLLPPAQFEFRVPVNQKTVIVPAGDKRLSAGWSDPDNTAQWLCLEVLPQTMDWWIDGLDCEGAGLWVTATTPGVRIMELRAMECSPTCGAPYSTTRRTVRVEFYVP